MKRLRRPVAAVRQPPTDSLRSLHAGLQVPTGRRRLVGANKKKEKKETRGKPTATESRERKEEEEVTVRFVPVRVVWVDSINHRLCAHHLPTRTRTNARGSTGKWPSYLSQLCIVCYVIAMAFCAHQSIKNGLKAIERHLGCQNAPGGLGFPSPQHQQ
ncbi:hypothetical protein OUZ56_030866 [Daphnia magna]|uniref:Uncharacterized protein n=1 Tax=Daphnia magna TaxID=35525 RepID=A0ABQ9ZSR2_9CRUS|nr:hypothetical protein OUZ56_030862 [Daphnia magna]KAK4015899.1 hypothetical protein OUZ56_030866 [Daphnia magna]